MQITKEYIEKKKDKLRRDWVTKPHLREVILRQVKLLEKVKV